MARGRHWRRGARGRAVLGGPSGAAAQAEADAAVAAAAAAALLAQQRRRATRRRLQEIVATAARGSYRHWAQGGRGDVLFAPTRAVALPHWSHGVRGRAILTPQAASAANLGKAPSQITGLFAYYTADGAHFKETARTNAVTTDLDRVGSLTDETGTKHLGSDDAGARPVYRPNRQNGLPGIVFSAPQFHRVFAAAVALPQPLTCFIVGVITGGDATSQCFAGSQTPFCLIGQSLGTVGDYGIHAGAGSQEFVHQGGAVHIYEHVLDGVSSVVLVDGVSKVAGTAGTNGINGGGAGEFNLGARLATTYNLTGDIYAAVFYSVNVSAGDRADLRTWLKNKWDTP